MKKSLALVGLLACAALIIGRQAEPILAAPASVSTAITTFNDCELVCCDDCCPGNYHDAWEPDEVQPFAMRNGGSHPYQQCFSGSCDTKHGPFPCDPIMGLETLESLRAAIAAANATNIDGLLAKHSKTILLNSSRLAIQVRNCNGDVVMHFPIERQLLGALTDN